MNFFTSDMHLGHVNVLRLCNRPFKTESGMASTIRNNHNSIVTDKDDVWDLGDVGYRCSAEYLVSQLEQFKGRRHILFGNHDKPLRDAFKKGLLNDMLKDKKIDFIGFPDPHKYPDLILNHRMSLIQQININGQEIIISHYAQRTWNKAFRGSWHLFGHSHTNLKGIYKSMDVGVDGHNFTPWSFEEIKCHMENIKEEFSED